MYCSRPLRTYFDLYPMTLFNTAPVGPVSGEAIWRVEVQPHSWGQEVADLIWQGLAWEEVTEDSEAPKRNVVETGWFCRMIISIEF